MRSFSRICCLALVFCAGLVSNTNAGFVFNLSESAGVVTISYSGSLNLVGSGAAYNQPATPSIIDGTRITVNPLQPANFVAQQFAGSFSGPSNFFPSLGEPDLNAASVNVASSLFAMSRGSGNIYTAPSFAGGTYSGSGSMTFNTTLAALGWSVGQSQVWTWQQASQNVDASNTITINAVPEPSSLACISGLVAGLSVLSRRRRQA